MRVEFLGTASSFGLPEIGCDCEVCHSTDPHDTRLRCSIWVTTPEVSVIVDTGPDFHQQCRRAGVRQLDAVLITHMHADHIFGMDDVRKFNVLQQREMPVYLPAEMEGQFRTIFHYCLTEPAARLTRPRFGLNLVDTDPFTIGDLTIHPIRIWHSVEWIRGYLFEHDGHRFAYLTDCHHLAPEDEAKVRGVDDLVLGALWKSEHTHPGHLNLAEAIDYSRHLHAGQTWFTHITHRMGFYAETSTELPSGIHLAYDGLILPAEPAE